MPKKKKKKEKKSNPDLQDQEFQPGKVMWS